MRLKLSLVTGDEVDDLSILADGAATAGQLAERLRASRPIPTSTVVAGPDLTLRLSPGQPAERTVPANTALIDAGVRSGDRIALTNAGGASAVRLGAAATLRVVGGQDAGKTFELPAGSSLVGRGRDCDVTLHDPDVSRRHLKVIVTDMIELVDDNSANGTMVNGEYVQRVAVRSTDRILIGDTELEVILNSSAGASFASGEPTIDFNRSPRLDPKYPGAELVAPEPPKPPEPRRFPWISSIAPIFMGVIMYAITKNVMSVLFIALSPVMIVGTFFEGRHTAKKQLADATVTFREGLRDLAIQLQYAADEERTARRREHPSVDEIVAAAGDLSELVWTRRQEHDSFLEVRLGLGLRPSRTTVKTPEKNQTIPDLWRELQSVVGEYAMIDRVPVVADPEDAGNLGVAGPSGAAHPVAAALVAQFVGLHSPAELVLGAVTSAESVDRWEWLKWLPHAGSEFSPLECEHLASSSNQITRLTSELEELVRLRRDAMGEQEASKRTPLPVVLVVVQDEAVVDRARLVQVAEAGAEVGVHLLWVAPSVERLPAACRTYLEVDAVSGEGKTGYVRTGEGVIPVELEPLGASSAMSFARRLSPVVDAGALLEDQSNLPRAVSFLTLAGPELEDPNEVIEHWRGSNSIPDPDGSKLKRDNTLRGLVGQGLGGRIYLDLRTQGPHALVGGTTGAGKSEFLQTWIMGMAAAHSPARVNFLLVDYKGGSAFADCVDLPHTVGLVTDLSPHLVQRALKSLKAELTRREHILNAHRAKDLLEMEKNRYAATPPSLVIVVDEFAALVGEVPEFIDGVVDVAQRGRSLGLHLVLATQRPSGVIKGSLRANTNLRVALRIADEEDSNDVIGSAIAAGFDPELPGRAAAKTGPGRLTSFQTGYVGGHTSQEPPPPSIDVRAMPFGVGSEWELSEAEASAPTAEVGETDIARLVKTINQANVAVGLPEPQKPWLPELAPTYHLEKLPTSRLDSELVYGVIDVPEAQQQPVVAFRPDDEGNMVVYGTGGSGKSAFLRAIAVAAGLGSARGGPCHVYGLDFGARGLAMLEEFPHVGSIINGDDAERTTRLLKMVRTTIDDRADRFAQVSASTIVQYREASGVVDEPRIILLVDNFGAFRAEYEAGPRGNPHDLLEQIAAIGPSVGVHVVVTADRANALSVSLRSVVQSQMSLRLSSDNDFMTLGVPLDMFGPDTPPGRGVIGENEVQVGVLGGSPNMARQAEATARLAETMRRAEVVPAPEIKWLPELVRAESLPAQVGGKPLLGIWDETLEPIGFEPSGTFVVSGPPQSGKTTTVLSLLNSIDRFNDSAVEYALFGPRRSKVDRFGKFDKSAFTAEDADVLARQLAADLESGRGRPFVVVIEGLEDYVSSMADSSLQDLVRICRVEGHFVIAEGELGGFTGMYGLTGMVKSDRRGIVLQPDQIHGDQIVSTDFPRVRRADFPPGRGLFAKSGRVMRIQIPMV